MVHGLRVTDEGGNRIGVETTAGRNLGKIVSGVILLISFTMADSTQCKQVLHDLMAHTLVLSK